MREVTGAAHTRKGRRWRPQPLDQLTSEGAPVLCSGLFKARVLAQGRKFQPLAAPRTEDECRLECLELFKSLLSWNRRRLHGPRGRAQAGAQDGTFLARRASRAAQKEGNLPQNTIEDSMQRTSATGCGGQHKCWPVALTQAAASTSASQCAEQMINAFLARASREPCQEVAAESAPGLAALDIGPNEGPGQGKRAVREQRLEPL